MASVSNQTPYSYYSVLNPPKVQTANETNKNSAKTPATDSGSSDSKTASNKGVQLSDNILKQLEEFNKKQTSGEKLNLLGVKKSGSNPVSDILGGDGDNSVTAQAYSSLLKAAYSGAKKPTSTGNNIIDKALKAYDSIVNPKSSSSTSETA